MKTQSPKKNRRSPTTDRLFTETRYKPAALQSWDSLLPIPELPPAASCAIVAVIAALCYANSVHGGFVFDDSEAIENNADITQESALYSLFLHDFWGDDISRQESHKSYRPLTVLTFRWTHYLAGGLHPLLFHLTNVVLHGVVSALSVLVSAALMGEGLPGLNQNTTLKCLRASLFCGVLFAVHPVHSESVAAVVGRADLLCALFFFLSFLAYVSACATDSSCLSLLLCVLFCAISMLCKEQGITVLGVCWLYDILYVGDLSLHRLLTYLRSSSPLYQLRHHTGHWHAILTRHALLLGTGLALCIFRYTIMGASTPQFTPADNPAAFADGLLTRVANYNYYYALNGWLLLNPMSLCFDWSMGCVPLIRSSLDPRVLMILSFWLILIFLVYHCAIRDSHQSRILSMFLAVLVITFLPASNIFFRVGFVIAERNLYLPSLGFIGIVVTGINALAGLCGPTKGRMMIQVFLVVLITTHMGKSVHRSHQWSVEEELYQSGLDVCPLNAKVHYNIAKAAVDRGKEKYAIASYREAIRLNPEYDHALNNLANLLKEDSQEIEAENLLKRAVHVNPSFAAAWMNLGIVQASLKKYDAAQQSYEQALVHRRSYPDCYFNLGNLYILMEERSKALNAWLNATSLHPHHSKAWQNCLSLLDNLDKPKEMCQNWMLLTEKQNSPEFLGALAISPPTAQQHTQFLDRNDHSRAAEFWRKAVRIKKTHVFAWRNLITLLDNRGELNTAVEVAHEALQHLPEDPGIHFILGNVLGKADRFEEAEVAFLTALRFSPGVSAYHGNIAVLYHRWKKLDKAEQHYERALEINPADTATLENLNKLRRVRAKQKKGKR